MVWTPPPLLFLLLHIKHFSSRTHQAGKWRAKQSRATRHFHSSRDDEETGASPRTSILSLSLSLTLKHTHTHNETDAHAPSHTHTCAPNHSRSTHTREGERKDFCSRMGGACHSHHRAPHLASQSKMSSSCC